MRFSHPENAEKGMQYYALCAIMAENYYKSVAFRFRERPFNSPLQRPGDQTCERKQTKIQINVTPHVLQSEADDTLGWQLFS
jgi:hypothetical protein